MHCREGARPNRQTLHPAPSSLAPWRHPRRAIRPPLIEPRPLSFCDASGDPSFGAKGILPPIAGYIRVAKISNVVLFNPQARIKAVCIKANAKNTLGGYTGGKVASVFLRNGVIMAATTGDIRCLDPCLGYHSFKELENLKNF